MLTSEVKKINKTYSLIVGYLFDTIIVAATDKNVCYPFQSKYKSCKHLPRSSSTWPKRRTTSVILILTERKAGSGDEIALRQDITDWHAQYPIVWGFYLMPIVASTVPLFFKSFMFLCAWLADRLFTFSQFFSKRNIWQVALRKLWNAPSRTAPRKWQLKILKIIWPHVNGEWFAVVIVVCKTRCVNFRYVATLIL